MSRSQDLSPERVRQQVRQHLEFYREMGVREVPAAPAPANTAPVARTSSGNTGDNASCLEVLRTQTIGDCHRCKLSEKRNSIVFGTGDPGSSLMFIGEGPGFDEDKQGLPFVGRAGKLLDQIIKAMGFAREQVYIANVVKCRPPENRTPQPDEVSSCSPFLFEQIDIIKPSVIVTLGAAAVQSLLGKTAGITKIRGTFLEFRGIRVMPTFHPAYLLRNPAAKRPVWEDMQQVMAYLSEGS